MRCPACQQETFETADLCSQCGFSLPALEKLMGFAPNLKPDVTDMAGELSKKELNMVRKGIARLEHRFPQVRCAVVISSTPPNITLPLHAFWLFNKGGLTSALERGGANRLVLLVLDPEAEKLACMIGYGLEPFVSEGRLLASMQAALASLASGEIGAGIVACMDHLGTHLAEVAESLHKAFDTGEEYQGLENLETNNAAALAF
ncbi:MAG: Psb32 and founding protein of phosphatase [Verrucomicrobiaceae bacterium]|nr:Psb32 and founding protein of phosphatase [Verrucomicrobiaceae bacterium]